MIKDDDVDRASELLDKFDTLRVLLCFDLFVVRKAGVFRRMSLKLETGIIGLVLVRSLYRQDGDLQPSYERVHP